MRRLGAMGPGLAWALLALLLAALLTFGLHPRWQAEADALSLAHQQARRQAARQAAPAALRPALPPPAAAGARLAALLALAAQHGVQVAGTQQRLLPVRAAEPEHQAVAMSAVAGYLPLRAFVQAALQADTALALQGLRLRRTSADDTLLQAELAWAMLHQTQHPNAERQP